MSRRAVVLILAAVIAAAVAIPALADPGPTAMTASVKGLSKRALAKAKNSMRQVRVAKRVARRGVETAEDAETAASAAQTSASTAQTAAAGALRAAASASEKAGGAELNSKEAKAEVASMRPKIGFAEGTKATTSETFVKLDEGPSVTLDVGTSGLIQVWAQAKVADGGVVSLYEDGQPVAGQADCFGGSEPPDEENGVLFASPGGSSGGEEALLIGTPASLPFCSTIGPPGPVLFQSTAGQHTFELRYAACGCSGTATFSERRLVVAPLP